MSKYKPKLANHNLDYLRDMRAILKKVDEEILTAPEKWTQEAWARAADGSGFFAHGAKGQVLHPDAACWCFSGATFKAAQELRLDQFVPGIMTRIFGVDVPKWNDDKKRRFRDIKSKLKVWREQIDRAIAYETARRAKHVSDKPETKPAAASGASA